MSIDHVIVALLGVSLGILVNYLADVLPYSRRLSSPVCKQCGKCIPLKDYIFGIGCSCYSKKLSWRYWLVILIGATGSLWLWSYPSTRMEYWVGVLLLFYLGVVALIDIETRLILHPVSIVGIPIGLGIGIWLHGFIPTLIGGAAGFFIMLLLYYLGDLFARFMARRRGTTLDEVALGFGDVNLSGILGLILGWPGIVAGLVLAIFLGGVVSLILIIFQVITRRYQPFTAIPYAPFLILGTVLLLYR
jgi:leader peptidase (prepilin peptidase) / N-methyltransferase